VWSASLHAARAAPRSVSVPLPPQFVAWLSSPGAGAAGAPGGAALLSALSAGIAAVGGGGGGAFVKLGPRAAHDAGWMLPGGAPRAEFAADVLALLRASERVGCYLDALRAAPAAAAPDAVVLKPWMELAPWRELRAFCVRGRAVAVAARHPGAHARGAAPPPDAAAALRGHALAFLAAALPRAPLRTCVLDFYVDARGRGWAIDFAPLRGGGAIDTLAFTEAELGIGGGAACASCRDGGAAATAARDPAPTPEEPATPLWRMAADDGDGGGGGGEPAAAPVAGPPPPPPDAAAALFASRAAAERGMAANRFPDELLLLAAATGCSVTALLEDVPAAVRKAGLAGGGDEPLLQGGDGSDDDDGEGGGGDVLGGGWRAAPR
jgi:hypothetical protein